MFLILTVVVAFSYILFLICVCRFFALSKDIERKNVNNNSDKRS